MDESRAVIVSQRLAEREMASGEVVEYIGWVQARFGGVWVCGLCEEAIKDERARLGVGVEVALRVHATIRETADASPPIPEAQSIVQLIKKIMSSTSSSPN